MGRIGYWISEALYAMLFAVLLVFFLLVSLFSAIFAATVVILISPPLLAFTLLVLNIIKYKIDH